jgi:C4-dicarboxylate transporter DctM subunit
MIIYGTFTEDSIAKLFMAGLLPGVILMFLLMLSVGIWATINPRIAPREQQPLKAIEIVTTVFDLLPFAGMVGLVLGTIYLGLVTPTEAAAVGCCLAILLSLIWGNMNLRVFRQAVQNTIRTSGAIMFIILAANLFSYAVGASGVSHNMTDWLVGLNLSRGAFLISIFVLYSIMGCLVDSIGMMVITIPLLQPVLLGYGIDTIWFGVVLVLLIELGQITPPLGINLFVIQGIRTSGQLEEVILGTLPFYLLIFLMIGLLVLSPDLALWLPSKMTLR